MPASRTLLQSARLFHLYSGVFLAPALLFFALTGGLQTFSFHETTKGSVYKPPAILVKLGQLHKKQTLLVPERKSPPPETRPIPAAPTPEKQTFDPSHLGDHTNQQKHDRARRTYESTPSPPDTVTPPPAIPQASPLPVQPTSTAKKQNLIPMKIFFAIAAIGLFFSTLTGIFMAYRYARNKIAITATLIAGIVIPLALLLLQ